MRRTLLIAGTTLVAVACAAPSVRAQIPAELYGYGGVGLPTEEWKTQGARSGWGYGLSLIFVPRPFFAFYGGADRFHLELTDDGTAHSNPEFNHKAMRSGIELRWPLRGATPFLSAGGFFGNYTLATTWENRRAEHFRGGASFGIDVGAGVDVDLKRFRVRPRAAYRSAESWFDYYLDEQNVVVPIKYLQFTLGASFVP